jgi:hypothetical protein
MIDQLYISCKVGRQISLLTTYNENDPIVTIQGTVVYNPGPTISRAIGVEQSEIITKPWTEILDRLAEKLIEELQKCQK